MLHIKKPIRRFAAPHLASPLLEPVFPLLFVRLPHLLSEN